MLVVEIFNHNLNFKTPGGTSRGILKNKPTWYIKIFHDTNHSLFGLGECGPIEGLSMESVDEIMNQLKKVQKSINDLSSLDLSLFPSIQFGIESALRDLKNGGKRIIFQNSFAQGKPIKINGLIWMGNKDFMVNQIKSKIEKGFSCLKLKIGSINFTEEISILKNIRKQFSPKILEIRVDANGALSTKDVFKKLETLGELKIHSIEQPIAINQWDYLREICEKSPIPIALDEELIQLKKEKNEFIKYISPHYLVLKPTLIGGFEATKKWIDIAEKNNINWWVTSALESNIGLNAIAQFCANYQLTLPQGLGTGQLFSNNIPSPLDIKREYIFYKKNKTWDLSNFEKSNDNYRL
jgi:o-succinylbenzoate synthase